MLEGEAKRLLGGEAKTPPPIPTALFEASAAPARVTPRCHRLPATGLGRDTKGCCGSEGSMDATRAGAWQKAVPRPHDTLRSLRCLGRARERVRHTRMPSTGLGRDAEGC